MSKGKIIIGCLDGGFSFWELRKWRRYLSEVARDVLRNTSFEHMSGREMRRAKGVMLDLPERLARRSVRRVYRFVEENAHPNNALVLLGKSAGGFNWYRWINRNPEIIAKYGWSGVVFVDPNIGPRAKNRNGETLELGQRMDSVTGLYTKDSKLGGYKVSAPGFDDPNYCVDGRDHFDVCRAEMVYSTVEAIIQVADRE